MISIQRIMKKFSTNLSSGEIRLYFQKYPPNFLSENSGSYSLFRKHLTKQELPREPHPTHPKKRGNSKGTTCKKLPSKLSCYEVLAADGSISTCHRKNPYLPEWFPGDVRRLVVVSFVCAAKKRGSLGPQIH